MIRIRTSFLGKKLVRSFNSMFYEIMGVFLRNKHGLIVSNNRRVFIDKKITNFLLCLI